MSTARPQMTPQNLQQMQQMQQMMQQQQYYQQSQQFQQNPQHVQPHPQQMQSHPQYAMVPPQQPQYPGSPVMMPNHAQQMQMMQSPQQMHPSHQMVSSVKSEPSTAINKQIKQKSQKEIAVQQPPVPMPGKPSPQMVVPNQQPHPQQMQPQQMQPQQMQPQQMQQQQNQISGQVDMLIQMIMQMQQQIVSLQQQQQQQQQQLHQILPMIAVQSGQQSTAKPSTVIEKKKADPTVKQPAPVKAIAVAPKKTVENPEENDSKRKRGNLLGLKGAKSSFIWFSSQMATVIKQQQPSMPQKDIVRALGQKWNSLSDEEKKPYVELARQDKARFDQELAQAKQKGPAQPAVKGKADLQVTNAGLEEGATLDFGGYSE